MVQVLPYVPSFGEKLAAGLTSAGSQLGEGYMKGRENKADAEVLQNLSSGNLSPIQQFSQYARLSKGARESLNPAFTQLLQSQNQSREKEADRAAALEREKIKAAAKGTKETPFEAALQRKNAEDYANLQKEIPKLQDTLGNVASLRDMSKNFSGAYGYGKALIGADGAADFDATGLTMIESAVKLFNPVGAIPVAKINLIKDKFAPKATDPQWVIDGKLDAIERYATQSLERGQNRLQILKQYGGQIPEEIEQQLNAQDKALVDDMTEEAKERDEILKKTQLEVVEKIPQRGKFKGQTATNNATGEVLTWDGKHWSKS